MPTTISGSGGVSGFNVFEHDTSGDQAPQLAVYQQFWTEVVTATTGGYLISNVWVENTGHTQLKDISLVVTIQGGNGIWAAQFCNSSGELIDARFQTFTFGDLSPGATSSKQNLWWKPSKPNVPQNGDAFEVHFTAIPNFTVSYGEHDDYFSDTSHVAIGE